MSKSKSTSNDFRASGIVVHVLNYQKSKSSTDYEPIKKYYDNFKEKWFQQVEDYLDRNSFESEFDYKLHRAVETFNDGKSKDLAAKNQWSSTGRFNRWFFRVLTNWKSNVKNSSFRAKKRPAVQCPICGRFVTRITEEHLQHVKTVSDLPKYMHWDGQIFEIATKPKSAAVCWGEYTSAKMRDLQNGNTTEYKDMKRKVKWPWKTDDGKRAVFCPLSKRIVPVINDEYLNTLSASVNRYAEPYSWEQFIELHPYTLIQSEMFSLEYDSMERQSETPFKNTVCVDRRIPGSVSGIDHNSVSSGNVPMDYSDTFDMITKNISDNTDREILKLVAIGYEFDQISETLNIKRADIRRRIKRIKEVNKELEASLVR